MISLKYQHGIRVQSYLKHTCKGRQPIASLPSLFPIPAIVLAHGVGCSLCSFERCVPLCTRSCFLEGLASPRHRLQHQDIVCSPLAPVCTGCIPLLGHLYLHCQGLILSCPLVLCCLSYQPLIRPPAFHLNNHNAHVHLNVTFCWE